MPKALFKTHLSLLLLAACLGLSAQETKIYLGVGGLRHAYQDTRFTNLQQEKYVAKPELGFSRIAEKDLWNANASAFAYNYTFPSEERINTSILGYNVRVGYLRNLAPNFYLGANWDIVDYWQRSTEGLLNGADAFKLSSDLYLSAKYFLPLNDNWGFEFGLDWGVLSFINQVPSFSAAFPQNLIDNGEITFVDADTRKAYKIDNMTTKAFWEMFYLRSFVELNFKKRLTLAYIWDMRTYSDNKSYPITNAMHSLMLRWHFVNHQKK